LHTIKSQSGISLMAKGRFFVIDGIDGSGSETQSKKLKDFLEKRGERVFFLDYPDYDRPIGNFINNYLYSNDHIPVEVKFILFTADFLKDNEAVTGALNEGKAVVACRYVTTALAYQVAEGFDAGRALEYTKLMGFPVPDIAVYLKIKPETSSKRKMEESGRLDRNESDLQLLSKVAARYDEMASKNIFCKWITIDGKQGIDKVFAALKGALGI
jgi:dTMP kinase